MIRRLHKFLKLGAADRRLLIDAWLRLQRVYLLMRLTPFDKLRARLQIPQASKPARGHLPIEKIIWAVETASRRATVGKTCLSRAIVAQDLLRRNGHDAELKIGVARGEKGDLTAHAWLVRDGRILLGALPNLASYQEFPSLERRSV